ncbi:PaaI family thioesterase [Frigidibacter oleivorans]|uniref:PaaI family thioesterase n=1 Tax=Frigidibacter oleivorans TaxID=2487129 RepID=UPI000F8F7371|nr:PaaI family thioesterase [Frigidibacter oleivorans]
MPVTDGPAPEPTGTGAGAATDPAGVLPPFARTMGLRLTLARPDRVEGEVTVPPGHANRNGVLHGGAVMAIIDCLAGTAAHLNIRPDQMTTTVESKTNFFRSVRIGEVLRGEVTPLHVGGRTHVWQTRLIRADGKVAALCIQTQMTIERPAD